MGSLLALSKLPRSFLGLWFALSLIVMIFGLVTIPLVGLIPAVGWDYLRSRLPTANLVQTVLAAIFFSLILTFAVQYMRRTPSPRVTSHSRVVGLTLILASLLLVGTSLFLVLL